MQGGGGAGQVEGRRRAACVTLEPSGLTDVSHLEVELVRHGYGSTGQGTARPHSNMKT